MTTFPMILMKVVAWVFVLAPSGSLDDAVVLLQESAPLCRLVASEAELSPSAGRRARRALVREMLDVAGGLLEDEAPRAAVARHGLARRSLAVQRSLCLSPGPTAGRSRSRHEEPELRYLAPVEAGSADAGRRQALWKRYLDRFEAATFSAAASGAGRPKGLAVPISPVSRSVREPQDGARRAAADRDVRHVAPERRERGSSAGDAESAAETPGPDVGEIARRQRRRSLDHQERLESWRPRCVAALAPLVAARRSLERHLGVESLAAAQRSCELLGFSARDVDYRLVLETPDASMRRLLDRLLAGYAAAGRWCADGRFAFAWNEIEQADVRLWSLARRLARGRSSMTPLRRRPAGGAPLLEESSRQSSGESAGAALYASARPADKGAESRAEKDGRRGIDVPVVRVDRVPTLVERRQPQGETPLRTSQRRNRRHIGKRGLEKRSEPTRPADPLARDRRVDPAGRLVVGSVGRARRLDRGPE